MWRGTFIAVLWAIWKERNCRCFEGKKATVEDMLKNLKQTIASWMLVLPQFKGIPLQFIVCNWREEASLPQWDWVLCCRGRGRGWGLALGFCFVSFVPFALFLCGGLLSSLDSCMAKLF